MSDLHQKIVAVRTREGLALPFRPQHLKDRFVRYDGVEQAVELRNYQVQAIWNLVLSPRFLLGDDTGLGKSLTSLTACALLWDQRPESRKVVVLTTKSAVEQWGEEVKRFLSGVSVHTVSGTPAKRKKGYQAFQDAPGPAILVLGYRSAVQDYDELSNLDYGVMLLDEASNFKTDTTQIHQTVLHLARRARWVWALTATMIKNKLMEGWGIYHVLVPDLFPTKNKFMYTYSCVQLQSVRGRQIPIVTGYLDEHIEMFREKITPYYLGRAKHDVAKELPALSVVERRFRMSPKQIALYKEALSGTLTVAGETKEVTPLTAVTYCQQIANHPSLMETDLSGVEDGDSAKLECLLDILDNELEGKKVIVFSRFRRMIDILEETLKKRKVKTVRITGSEDPKARQKAASTFQDAQSGFDIVLITTAAAEAINLQSASAIVFFDSPWSGGDFIQLIGRMIRIGSKHTNVLAYHLVARGSIDVRVMEVLRGKMKLIGSVMGERIQAEQPGSDVSVLFAGLQEDASRLAMTGKLDEDE
jgi:SNF2 family DNA or RNA helicase